MFSLQPCDELVFATPTTPQEYQIPHHNNHHQIMDHAFSEGNLISFSATKEEQLIQSPNLGSRRQTQKGQSRYGSYDRRVMHRDIERKRREETSNLYASLRTLLPVEHSKGKGSVSDQLTEATNYIKQMNEKMQELRTRRDKLKKLQNSSCSGTNGESSLHNCVSVHQVQGGMEILISKKSHEFELSEVLTQLSEREIDVVSCISTRAKGEFLHKIDIKGGDTTSLDVRGLHDRLRDAINCNGYCIK